nr:hypothetical protein [Tanacetum cinerariifolium]
MKLKQKMKSFSRILMRIFKKSLRSKSKSRSRHPMPSLLISKIELKKILIEKMEGNKSIHRSDKQRNLYKALVEAYESNKISLDTYRDTVMLKRRHDDDADKDEETSAGSDRGPRDEEKERSQSQQALQRRKLPGPLASADDQPVAETSQHPKWFSQQKKPPTPDRHRVIMFDHFINNDLEYLRGGASSRKYTTSVTKTKAADYGHIKWIKDLVPCTMWIQEPVGYDKHALWGISHWGRKHQQFYRFAVNRESTRDVYSKRRIIAVTELKIVEWRVEDLQLGVKRYQKKLNLTRTDTYHSDLKYKEAYTAYSNPRGFIYQNKDKQNRLMRIDELHKFSDGTLNDVRTALDDRLKGIRMKYLPWTIWRKSDKERAAAMIQAIDKQLKTRRIMRSLERFIGERLYEEDFRMLQRTI